MQSRAYGPFPYSPITERPPIRWPNGARVALWVIPNVEFMPLDQPVQASKSPVPDVRGFSDFDYGNRIAVFRLMEVLDRFGIRATVALNSDICDHHPEIVAAGIARRWEFMGHGQSNTRWIGRAGSDAAARSIVTETLARIAKATGVKPRGWLGSGLEETWNTLDHLVDEGVSYVADWVNDDEPYRMDIGGGRSIMSIPYSTEINDRPAYVRNQFTPDEFTAMIRAAFDVYYREGERSGRVMAIALHPNLSGVPHRIDALAAGLDYVCKHDGVWLATGSEIIDAYVAQQGRV
ncbi:MAG TPA: polysaccharide deacetylase family protein [Alphaproteobacteria bacterium]|jgi:peptidoglycan/xylan/chitin deacetylase (PgdA/CDA1 family)|nr:polysaccharide deacetylase family protein [Alphaproteobacteria bacterium]